MKKLLILLFAASAAFAETPARKILPDDYKPSPCAADADAVCQGISRDQFTRFALTHRGYDIAEDWIDAHWEEFQESFRPICAKIGNCFTVPGNNWVYCVDITRPEVYSLCDRFPEDSEDREQCDMFVFVWWLGLGPKTELHAQSQECIKAQPARAEPGKLEFFMEPERLTHDFDGKITIHAIDAERRVPVRARVTIDSGRAKGSGGPYPSTGYPIEYQARLKRVPNAETGHRDVVAPTFTLTAEGYEPVVFTAPMDLPQMTVEMSPRPDMLRRGPNVITITATDVATGEPVPLRVMGGELVLGESNKPFVLEIEKGEKLPEIWVTSLYDRYSDVVVVPAK